MLTVLTPPTGDVLTLAKAKLHLRVAFNDDDDAITDYLATAVELCQDHIARACLETSFRLTLPAFPGQCTLDARLYDLDPRYIERSQSSFATSIPLPRSPVQTVDAITYLDPSGVRQTLASSLYAFEAGDASEIVPAYGRTWPTCQLGNGSVRIDFTAGYAAADSIPAKLKHAVKVTLAYLYENRGAEEEIPMAALDLLRSCAWGWTP